MESQNLPERWLRGPVENIIPLLQPVAHALLQAQDEINAMIAGLPEDMLWKTPGGKASIAFHLKHIAGVHDRLLTYAGGNQLSDQQMRFLKSEGISDPTITLSTLLSDLNKQFDTSLQALTNFTTESLTEPRGVGRKQFPSTVIGLLFHIAEHTMRHSGQLLVTIAVIK